MAEEEDFWADDPFDDTIRFLPFIRQVRGPQEGKQSGSGRSDEPELEPVPA